MDMNFRKKDRLFNRKYHYQGFSFPGCERFDAVAYSKEE